MLFQLVVTKFFKSELFSCLPKVGHVIKSCKEPIIAGKDGGVFLFYFHIQVYLLNFQYVANVFYFKIGKSSYYAWIVAQMLLRNPWNRESAGYVYFSISRKNLITQ